MARLARLALAGCVHHVVQRGIGGQPVFRDEDDFRRMQAELAQLCRPPAVALHAYVLLPDHFHLLLTPAQGRDLSHTMQALGRRYVRAYNARYGRSGTLWQGRYRATVIEPRAFLLDCMRFVELHPARSGLVEDAVSYPWSSLAHHLGRRTDPMIVDHEAYWALGNTPFDRQAAYARLCAMGPDPACVERIVRDTRRGWPIGSSAFLEALGRLTERRLERRPAGRPRRARVEDAS